MTFSNNTKGFTLIELLVVIAVIGLLASVVMTTLQDSRKKAGSAAAHEQAQQIRTAAEIASSGGGAQNYPASTNDYRASSVSEIENNLGGNPVPRVPQSINDDGIYYYISTDNDSTDQEGVNFYCMTENDSFPNGTDNPHIGPAQGSMIVAWRDTNMTEYPASDPSEKKLFVALNTPYNFGSNSFVEAFETDNAAYYPGPGTVGSISTSPQNSNMLLWSWDGGTNYYPIACEVLK